MSDKQMTPVEALTIISETMKGITVESGLRVNLYLLDALTKIKKAAEDGLESASQPPAVKGLHWVDCKNQLPDKDGLYIIEDRDRNRREMYFKTEDQKWYWAPNPYSVCGHGFIERWLDESPTAAGDGKEAMKDIDLIELVLQRWAGKSKVVHTGDGDYEIIVRRKLG